MMGAGEGRAPQRSSRSFHGLQDFLPQARGVVSKGGQRFTVTGTAAVTGTSSREVRYGMYGRHGMYVCMYGLLLLLLVELLLRPLLLLLVW